jgi:hypothetical protein
VLEYLVTLIDGSVAQQASLYLLSQIRGFPPVIQTVHILSIAAIMGSTVLIDMRLLGLMVRSQRVSDLVRRLMPWTWYALPLLFISGIVFVFARPQRYAINPIFRWKFIILLPAILVTLAFHLVSRQNPEYWESSPGRRLLGKGVAVVSLMLWLLVVLAGRWIAYADYLIPPEE